MHFVVVYVNQKYRRYLSPFLTPNRKDKLDLLETRCVGYHPKPIPNQGDIHRPSQRQIKKIN